MALNNLQLVSDTTLNNGDKEKALDAAISQIERSFGKGSIMKLGSREGLPSQAPTQYSAQGAANTQPK